MSNKYPPIQVDTREQLPLRFDGWPTVRETLPVGDYGIKGFSDFWNPQIIIERKSLPDLVGSLTRGRERFLKEVVFGLARFRFAGIVIEGITEQVEAHAYRSAVDPDCILGSLNRIMLNCPSIHVFWWRDAEHAARRTQDLFRLFLTGIEKQGEILRRNAKRGERENVTSK